MTVTCLLCGASLEPFQVFERRVLLTKPVETPDPTTTGDMAVAYCAACHHISSRIDTSHDLAALAERVYRELYAHYSPTDLSPSQRRWTDFVAAWLVERLPERARVLEIGSHDGYILEQLARRGHRCVGVEPSPHGSAAPDHTGVETINDFFRAGLFPDASFDAVILRHVVEHVPAPVTFVRDAVAAVRPGGLVYIEVPDSRGSVDERFFPEFHIDHVSYFSTGSVARLLNLVGTRRLHLESAWAYMRFPFLCTLAERSESEACTTGTWFQDFNIDAALQRVTTAYERYLEKIRRLPDLGAVAVWGTGSIGTQCAVDGRWESDAVTYVDINQGVHGLRLSVTGHLVEPPSVIRDRHIDTVLIASGWEADARHQLQPFVSGDTRIINFSDLIADHDG